jgi:spore coat protein A
LFDTSTYTYDNSQQAATLWYHDHALGMTRLNVYAGLAGFYVLQDENRDKLVDAGVLPSGDHDIGAVIQDRAFTKDGELYYPAYKTDPLPGTHDHVKDAVPKEFYKENGNDASSIVPEFFGDTILVNGMAWPKLTVEAGDYELRLLNGSDSRFYVLEVDPAVGMYLVGTDGGLLPKVITVSDGDGVQESNEFLVLAPGDRLEVVFDFSNLDPGDTVNLLNVGPAFEPFKGVADADGSLAGGAIAATADDPVGNIMQFQVIASDDPFDAKLLDKDGNGVELVENFVDLAQDSDGNGVADAAYHVRQLGLFEGVDDFGRVTPMLGKAEAGTVITDKMSTGGNFGPLSWDAETTEKPLIDTTEQWDLFNFTEDSHPIHLHLPQFQVVGKWHIDFLDGDENGIPDDTTGDGLMTYGTISPESPLDYSVADIWIGDEIPLRPEETGWQDTIEVDPHQMAAVVATFDKEGDYVWHCHILSHEDNEMMRPYTVVSDFDLFA